MSNQPTTCTIDEADRKAIVKRRFDVWDMRLYSMGIITFIAVSSLSAASHIGGLKQSMMPYVRSLAVLLGIEQSWQVFAPDPRRMNLHNSAVITFQDGSMKMYEFPRMDLIKGWERFRLGDRQRKLFDEWMSEPRGEPYRSDLARYLVQCNENPLNQPVLVSNVFNFVNLSEPSDRFVQKLTEVPAHRSKSVYFVFQVRRTDFLP